MIGSPGILVRQAVLLGTPLTVYTQNPQAPQYYVRQSPGAEIATTAAGRYALQANLSYPIMAKTNVTCADAAADIGPAFRYFMDPSGNVYDPALGLNQFTELIAGMNGFYAGASGIISTQYLTFTGIPEAASIQLGSYKFFPVPKRTTPGVQPRLMKIGGDWCGEMHTGSIFRSPASVGIGLKSPGTPIPITGMPGLAGDTAQRIQLGTYVDFYVDSPNQVYGETVTLQAEVSVPGGVASCQFDFGNGSYYAESETATAAYDNAGTYTLTMTVTSNEGQTFTRTKTLNIYGYTLKFIVNPSQGAVPFKATFTPVWQSAKP